MENTDTIQIIGNNYPKSNIKYAYTGNKVRYKRFLKYPAILLVIITIISWLISTICIRQYLSYMDKQPDLIVRTQLMSSMSNVLQNISIAYRFLAISTIVAFFILLIPRIYCLFLKITGNKKDIILLKSIHKNEVAIVANEINDKIRNNTFSSFPY